MFKYLLLIVLISTATAHIMSCGQCKSVLQHMKDALGSDATSASVQKINVDKCFLFRMISICFSLP